MNHKHEKKKRPLKPKPGLARDHVRREQDQVRHLIEDELDAEISDSDIGWAFPDEMESENGHRNNGKGFSS